MSGKAPSSSSFSLTKKRHVQVQPEGHVGVSDDLLSSSRNNNNNNSNEDGKNYHMRANHQQNRFATGSSAISESLVRHRVFSSQFGNMFSRHWDPAGVFSSTKKASDMSLWQRLMSSLTFEDKKIESDFQAIQKRAAVAALTMVLCMIGGIELLTVLYDLIKPPGPASVYYLRLFFCLVGVVLKLVIIYFSRRKTRTFMDRLALKSACLTFLQSLSLVMTQNRRALALFNVDRDSLCNITGNTVEDTVVVSEIQIDQVYCGNNWASADSLLLMCLVVYIASVSYGLGMVVVSFFTALNSVIAYIFVSLIVGVYIHPLDAMMLALLGFICVCGSYLSEIRLRDLFDRTLITKEAIRRNRKLRASFDRHVDNEKTLLEQTQALHEENKILRKKAEVLDESMSNIELESPLMASINEIREIQRQAKMKNNLSMVETLEKVIKNLQSKSLADIDISVTTKQSSALDAKTKEWLSDATSGWEQRRNKNRKLRSSSDTNSRPIIRESVTMTHDGVVFGGGEKSNDGIGEHPLSPKGHVMPRGTTSSEPGRPSVIAANPLHASMKNIQPMQFIKDSGCSNSPIDELSSSSSTQSDDFTEEEKDGDEQLPEQSQSDGKTKPGTGSIIFNEKYNHQGSNSPKGTTTLIHRSQLIDMLEDAHEWNKFDIIKFAEHTNFPITALVDYSIAKQDTLSFMDISYSRLITFMQHVDRTYCYGQTIDQTDAMRSKMRNPYHNNLHAADVVQSVFCFLTASDIFKEMSQLDIFSCIIAAAIHDYHHPGRTNQFLVTQGHPIAIQHNDQSPNERFHLSEAFRVMQQDNCNFLLRLPLKQRLEIRQTIIDLVLATDLAQTMKYLSSFQLYLAKRHEKTKVYEPNGGSLLSSVQEEVEPGELRRKNSSESLNSDNSTLDSEESILLLQIAIKVADISHPSKPLQLHTIWSEKIQQEFFIQGDIQKEGGFNVDPLCDRDNVNVNKAQMGFIDFVCRPLIRPFSEFINMPCLMENLVHNYKYWSEHDVQ